MAWFNIVRYCCLALGAMLLSACPSTLPVVPKQISKRYDRCGSEEGLQAYAEAKELMAAEKLTAAAARAKDAIGLCPEYVPAHLLYQDLGRLRGEPFNAEMLEFYAEYPDQSDSPLRPFLLARLERRVEREAECQKLLQESLRRDPNFHYAHLEMGRMWLGVGRSGKALESLVKARSLQPGHMPTKLYLAKAYAAQGGYSKAAQNYRSYLRTNKSDAQASLAFASLLVYRLHEPNEAEPVARELLQGDSSNPDLCMLMAATLWLQGKAAEAVPLYQQALMLDPQNARAALNLGNLYMDVLGRQSEASKREAWAKARLAYRYYQQLEEVYDFFDFWDLRAAVPQRLAWIDEFLGTAADDAPVKVQDL